MTENDDWFDADESEAIEYIRSILPESLNEKIKDTQIEFVIEEMYVFFDKQGVFEKDDNEVIDVNEDEITEYIFDQLKEEPDFSQFSKDDLRLIINAELDYCNFL